MLRLGLGHHEANALPLGVDVLRVRYAEARDEAFSRTLRIKPSDAQQAFAHGFDANNNERLEVAGTDGRQMDFRHGRAGASCEA